MTINFNLQESITFAIENQTDMMELIAKKTKVKCIPVSQRVPSYPGTQVHVYWFTKLLHVAPF